MCVEEELQDLDDDVPVSPIVFASNMDGIREDGSVER